MYIYVHTRTSKHTVHAYTCTREWKPDKTYI